MLKWWVVAVLTCFCHGASAQELIIESSSDGTAALLEEARMAFHGTWFEKADDLFRRLLILEPDLAIAHGYLAVVDMFLYRDHSEHAASALQLSDEQGDGEWRLTEILVRFVDGDLEAAESLAWEFLREYPDDRFVQHIWGLIQTDFGEGEEAIETLRELIRNHPDYVPAWNHLSNAFIETGQMEKAEAAAEMFLELAPENPSAYDGVAELRAREGRTDEAVQLLKRAIELDPRMAFAWMHMGDILSAAGLADDAELAYRRGLESSILYGDRFREEIAERMADLQGTVEAEQN